MYVCMHACIYSIETKCREFSGPELFDWQTVLTDEAEPMWKQERAVAKEPAQLMDRSLLIVQL